MHAARISCRQWIRPVAAAATVACLGAAGCGSRARAPAAGAGIAAHSDEATARLEWGSGPPRPLPLREPRVIAGEQLIWRVSLFGMNIGEIAYAVGAPGTLDGRPSLILRSNMRTLDTVAALGDMHQEVTTVIDMASGRPHYHRRHFLTGGELSVVEAQFVPERVTVTYRNRDGSVEELQHQVPADTAFDTDSLLLAVRAWSRDGEAGDRLDAHTLRESRVWHAQMEIAGRETISSATFGEVPCVRIIGLSRRTNPDGTYDDSEEPREMTMWLSADERRIPLRILGQTFLGHIRMELVHYAPGSLP
jgi:hypothetical protein